MGLVYVLEVGTVHVHFGLPGTSEPIEPNLVTSGFLELLNKLHNIFLQVS